MDTCPHCKAVIPTINDMVVLCSCEDSVREELEYRQRSKQVAATLRAAKEEQQRQRQKRRRTRNRK